MSEREGEPNYEEETEMTLEVAEWEDPEWYPQENVPDFLKETDVPHASIKMNFDNIPHDHELVECKNLFFNGKQVSRGHWRTEIGPAFYQLTKGWIFRNLLCIVAPGKFTCTAIIGKR